MVRLIRNKLWHLYDKTWGIFSAAVEYEIPVIVLSIKPIIEWIVVHRNIYNR